MMLGAVGRERAGGRRRRPRPGLLGLAVVAGQRAQSLERQLVEQVGRDQVELEDRLPQVAVVLLAVDLRGPHLLGGQQPFLSRTVIKRLLGRREAREHELTGRGSADPAVDGERSTPREDGMRAAKDPRRRPPRRAVRPRVPDGRTASESQVVIH